MAKPHNKPTSIRRRFILAERPGMDPHDKGEVSSKCKSKIMARFDGPFEILEQIGPNAYSVGLPGEYGAFATFNVDDHGLYFD